MRVSIGNTHAIDVVIGPDGKKTYVEVEGKRITSFNIPEGTSIINAFSAVIDSMRYHMASGAKPEWIESDSSELLSMLASHYEVDESPRPIDW